MATAFTRNYRDHSNDTGYQFEFFCDKCGNGFRSPFQTSALGVGAKLLRAASGFLGGGRLSQAGYGADHLKDALRGPAWDDAFKRAIEQMKPRFRQCTRCGTWVCPEVCWNEARQLCEACAPDLATEAAALQAQAQVEQLGEKIRGADQLAALGAIDPTAAMSAGCPHCRGALKPGAKFCGGCGKAVAPAPAARAFCSQCGAQLTAGERFCSGCGAAA